MKEGFGEFTAYPDPRRPGYLRMNPAFVNRHLASRTVPLLGRFTCHERVFPALIRAMKQLRRQGPRRRDPQLRGLLQRAHGDAHTDRRHLPPLVGRRGRHQLDRQPVRRTAAPTAGPGRAHDDERVRLGRSLDRARCDALRVRRSRASAEPADPRAPASPGHSARGAGIKRLVCTCSGAGGDPPLGPEHASRGMTRAWVLLPSRVPSGTRSDRTPDPRDHANVASRLGYAPARAGPRSQDDPHEHAGEGGGAHDGRDAHLGGGHGAGDASG